MAEASLMDVTEIFDTVRDAELQIAQQTLEGMDITLLDPRLKQTVLFFAAARVKPGALKLTRICLNKGVQLDAHDSLKQTPLYYAAKVGNLQVARLLIGLGMDPNFRDTHGQTAVFYAVLRGHLQMMRLLSGMGAALDVRSNEGKTPSHMTKSNELKTEIRRLIAEHKARAEHEIHRCGKDPNKILEVKKLQDQKLDPERVCPDGQTRIPMVHWMFRHAPEKPFSPIPREDDKVIAESSGYFVCIAPANAAKRIRQSETGAISRKSSMSVSTLFFFF